MIMTVFIDITAEADPGSVKGGGGAGNPNSSMPRPKITKIGRKGGGGPAAEGRFPCAFCVLCRLW